MRQTSLSPCMSRVSWEPCDVIFITDGVEAAGVWAVLWPRPSREAGAGLETRQATPVAGGLTLLHRKHPLLILNAVPRHPQFKMHIYKNLLCKLVPSLQPKCHVVTLIPGSELFEVMFYYPLSNQTCGILCLLTLQLPWAETLSREIGF